VTKISGPTKKREAKSEDAQLNLFYLINHLGAAMAINRNGGTEADAIEAYLRTNANKVPRKSKVPNRPTFTNPSVSAGRSATGFRRLDLEAGGASGCRKTEATTPGLRKRGEGRRGFV